MKEMFNFKLVWKDIKYDFKRQNLAHTIFRYMLIIIGSAILAMGDAFFIIPYDIVTGGIAGFAILANRAFNWTDVNMTITIAQWVLFLFGTAFLGIRFGFKTIISSVAYPGFLYLFTYIYDNNAWAHLQIVETTVGGAVPTAILLVAGLAGGSLVGIGCGLTFVGGGSTGGVDCIALAIAKYFKVKTSVTSFVIDAAIVGAFMFIASDIRLTLVGLIGAFACAFLIGLTYKEEQNSYVADIVSEKWELINNEINYKLDRGTTLLQSFGGYTGKEKMMIHVVFSKEDYDEILKLVFKYDPDAFVFTTKAHEATGEGFTKIPYRISRQLKFTKKDKSQNIVITKNKLRQMKDDK